ncbi:hypothetical protein BT96DRAFT_948990 [Gymnopus androsaceus JB14]|uniref:Uncharacterized protein n=1 Tax=Gymnopus androsaceus JB14 TaxID=1447944 RepID=A0A6A4GLZ8_9AGAR|nr:hypothetical protein BT96DRAFT_948990 [Gymnopus androsaceus JB14]
MYSELVYFCTGPPPLEEKKSLLVNVVHILSLLRELQKSVIVYNGFAPTISGCGAMYHRRFGRHGLPRGEPHLLNRSRVWINARGGVGAEEGTEGGGEDTGGVRASSGGEISPSDVWVPRTGPLVILNTKL